MPRDAGGVSGEVWLECVIERSGLPQDIVVISPLGYGLDEKAMEAVSKWTFRPATKAGTPVGAFAQQSLSSSTEGRSD